MDDGEKRSKGEHPLGDSPDDGTKRTSHPSPQVPSDHILHHPVKLLSITQNIGEMRDQIQQLKTEGTDWLQKLMGHWGIPSWGTSILQFVFQVVIILIFFSC